MKRLVVLLFGLVGAALFMSAANSGDRVLRDSIFLSVDACRHHSDRFCERGCNGTR